MFTYIFVGLVVFIAACTIIALYRQSMSKPSNASELKPDINPFLKTKEDLMIPATTPVVTFNSNVFERATLLGSVLTVPPESVVERVELIVINSDATLVRVVLKAVAGHSMFRYLEYVTHRDSLLIPQPVGDRPSSVGVEAYTTFTNACKGLLLNDVHYFESREVLVPDDSATMDLVIGKSPEGVGAPVVYLDEFGQERPYTRIGFSDTEFTAPLNTTYRGIYPDGREVAYDLYYAAYQSTVDYLSINTIVELSGQRSIHCFFCVGIDVTSEIAIPYNVPL